MKLMILILSLISVFTFAVDYLTTGALDTGTGSIPLQEPTNTQSA